MFDKPNWQDPFLGGLILAGFIATAIIAAVLTMIFPSKTANLSSSKVEVEIKPVPTIPPR
jgi:hypothetical protein